jgi:uncharacterized protein YbcI
VSGYVRRAETLLFLSGAPHSRSENRGTFVLGTEKTRAAGEALAIGTAISRLYREHYGRGATTTRTIYQRDYVIAFLEDIFTPAERTMIEVGNYEDVKRTRQAFQMAMRERFSAAVEQRTGRKVVAFMSQIHFDPDMAAEIFVLAPRVEDDGSESGLV